jgi:hypothetical protein
MTHFGGRGMVDVFISYSQKDRTIAEALAEKLTANGIERLVGHQSRRR